MIYFTNSEKAEIDHAVLPWQICQCAYLENVGLSHFPFARVFVSGLACPANLRWRGAAGL
jgi:hypothetical protein